MSSKHIIKEILNFQAKPKGRSGGFIKGRAPGKLTGCEQEKRLPQLFAKYKENNARIENI